MLRILIGAAIGYLLKEDSKQQDVKVVKQYVQDNHSYNYTQNNYTYNDNRTYNVNSNNNVRFHKKKSYRVSYRHSNRHKKNKQFRFRSNQCFLNHKNDFQQSPNYQISNRYGLKELII